MAWQTLRETRSSKPPVKASYSRVPLLCTSEACGAEGGGDDLDGGDKEGGRLEGFELKRRRWGPVGETRSGNAKKKWVTQNKFCVTF